MSYIKRYSRGKKRRMGIAWRRIRVQKMKERGMKGGITRRWIRIHGKRKLPFHGTLGY